MSKYKNGVVIGRFQPLHDGHVALIKQALLDCEKVYIFIGSSNSPRTIKNPFTYHDRIQFFYNRFDQKDLIEKMIFIPLEDRLEDKDWFKCVIDELKLNENNLTDFVFYTSPKDKNSKWLSGRTIEVVDTGINQCATNIRDAIFKQSSDISFFKRLKEEYEAVQKEIEKMPTYEGKPVPMVTADLCLFHNDYVILIRRNGKIGNGLLALSGGFFDCEKDDSLFDCAVREFHEETGIELSEEIMNSKYKFKSYVSDNSWRSVYGRIITTVFFISVETMKADHFAKNIDKYEYGEFDENSEISEVVVRKVSELERHEMFADHYELIKEGYELVGREGNKK